MPTNCSDRIYNEDYADFMFKYGESLDQITNSLDTCINNLNYDTTVVYTPISELPSNFFHLYGYGVYPNCYGLLDIASIEASGVARFQNIPQYGLRGQGVLIGVVDTGIDFTHEAFIKEDGTSKIYSIWDQSIESVDAIPEGYYYGTEYSQNQINEALASTDPRSIVASVDEDGHGTFLSGIAAGNRSEENDFTGVVPDAELLVVKLKPAKKFLRDFWRIPDNATCFQKNDLMFGIKYLVETANKAKKPISIFIGIGTSQGAHDDRGALSSYISTLAAQSGVSISIAGGNEGNRGHHYFGTIEKGTEYDTVELNVGPNESGFSMELWAVTPGTFSIDILSPTGEFIPRIQARLNESREVKFIFERTVINIDYQIVEAQSGVQLILIRFTTPSVGIWRFRVYSNINFTLDYHVWLPIHLFISDSTYFAKPDNNYTLTSPGNTFIPIVTTAYNHTNSTIFLNASNGFMRNNNIAPTIAAPGVDIIGPALNSGYRVSSGTSIAAAHTAGVAAMLLEWGIVQNNYVQISTIEIKQLIIRGAKRYDNLEYPNKIWGYGILDIYEAFISLRT